MRSSGSTQAPPLITVLGASGLLGSVLTATLAERQVRLRVVSRRPAAVPAGRPADIDVRTTDLTGPGQVAAAIDGSDAVIHLVANTAGWRQADQDPDSERVNVGVMRDLVAAITASPATPPAVLYAGSISQVGTPPRTRLDGTEPDHPDLAFDRQKYAAERLLLDADAAGIVRGAALRFPSLYGCGPGGAVDSGVLTTVMRRALTDEPITMWHDGTVQRDLLHVRDAAAALVAGLTEIEALAGRHWLVGTGVGVSLGHAFREVADVAAACTGGQAVPVMSVRPPADAAAGDLTSTVIDSTAFRERTGWHPTVPLRDGLRELASELAARVPQPADR